MEEAIAALLLATAAVSSLVGNRITSLVRPQKSALPAIVLTFVSQVPEYADDGEAGIAESRLQVDCWGDTYSSAKAVARAVKDRLSATAETAGGVVFAGAWIDREEDLYETGAGDKPLYRVSLDFLINHSL